MNKDSTDRHAESIAASGVGEAWAGFMRPMEDEKLLSFNELAERVDKLEDAVRQLYMLHGRDLPDGLR